MPFRFSLRPRFRVASAAILTGVLILASTGLVAGGNFGAGKTDPLTNCLNRGHVDTVPPIYEEWDSECTTHDKDWYVYIGTSVPDIWRNSLVDSIVEDFVPVSDFNAFLTTSCCSPMPDTWVLKTTVPNGDPYGMYTTCDIPGIVVEDGGNGLYRYCKPQLIILDPQHAWTQARDGVVKREWLACHELAHTTGLQHRNNLYTSIETCLSYNSAYYNVLGTQEIEHLNDCYPRPTPFQNTLTAACDN